MATSPHSAQQFRFRNLPLFLALILIAGCILPFAARGQSPANITPDRQEPPAPAPAAFQNLIPGDQLAFLNDFAGRPAKEAMKDKRFSKLLKLVIPHSEYHYGRDMPLSDASDDVLAGSKLPVTVRDGRYVMVSGKQGPYLDGRGFLWFDIQSGIALGGVYFHPTNGEPSPTLAIFSRQLQDHSLGLSQLPLAFAEDLSRWVSTSDARLVSPRYFIPENGKKYVLLHDEDYCDHPPNAPAPPQDACMQLNAEAADADLNAAYFMQQTHNAANATAWMMLPEQVSWIGVRDRSCGLGPGTLPCRIRITRQRTRVVLRQQGPGLKAGSKS
jgi:uncharacterized protein YecT (DUF1311 family)